MWSSTSSLTCGKASQAWRKQHHLPTPHMNLHSHTPPFFLKHFMSSLCQAHGSSEGSSGQLDQESGHRVGSVRSTSQRCCTCEYRSWHNTGSVLEVFLIMYSFQVCVFICLQGTIFSKTAMENYKDFGPTLFKMSVPFSPAKRLGVPEEVSSSVAIPTIPWGNSYQLCSALWSNKYAKQLKNVLESA